MLKNKQQYCSISEFAQLCDVSKQTLQYYDKMGIFSPEFVDDNGYRYYAFYQLDAFRILMALKAIHTPLKTIKDYLHHRSREDLQMLLSEQQKKIEQEIAQLELASQIIQNKVAQIAYAETVDFEQMRIVYQPEERLVLSEPLPALDDKKYSKTVADHIGFCKAQRIQTNRPIGSIIAYETLQKHQLEFTYWFSRVDETYTGAYAFTKPAGWYAVGYYSGYYGTNPEIYYRLQDFIKDSGYQIAGHAYENSVVDMFMADRTEDYVTEVAIQVEPLEKDVSV